MPKAHVLDDVVMILFAFGGLAGAVVLDMTQNASPLIVAILASTALAALLYRFLGGIRATDSFAVGGLKVGGSAAVLIGAILVLNPVFAQQFEQRGFLRKISRVTLVGSWKSQYAPGGSEAIFNFYDSGKDITFDGYQRERTNTGEWHETYRMQNGVASIVGDGVKLTCKVIDQSKPDQQFIWETPQPLVPQPCLQGRFLAHGTAPLSALGIQEWGIGLQKR